MISIYGLELNSEKHPVLVKEKDIVSSNDCVSMPDDVFKLMQEVFNMSCLAEEHLYMIAINNKCRVLGISLVSSGSNTQTFCCSNSVYTRALLLGATGVVVVHNHVSGDPSPSKDDKKCLDKLRQAGLIVDVALQDFVIVGDGVYYSAKEQGDLE